MSILKIARMGTPVLRENCREVSPEDIRSEEIQHLIDDMIETMRDYEGVGLAAPQVYEPIRLSVVGFGPRNDRYEVEMTQELKVYFNPKVTVVDEETTGMWEGCLSVPGLRGWVDRPREIRVEFLDRKGEEQSLTAKDFLAVVLQHEFDHLDGVLYLDRIKDPTKLAYLEEFNRYIAPGEVDDDDDDDEDSDGNLDENSQS